VITLFKEKAVHLHTIKVRVLFEGEVTVEVPAHLAADCKQSLAKNVALARVLATLQNDDCGECLVAACDEFVKESWSGTEQDFDIAEAVDVTGFWRLAETPAFDASGILESTLASLEL
jgi:hypothetical protein